METIFVLFMGLLFLVGFVFILKDYYREKSEAEKANTSNLTSDNNSSAGSTISQNTVPKFISTNRERIYIIAISVLAVIVLVISLLCNVLFRRCVSLQNECKTLKQEVVQLKQDTGKTKSSYEEEMDRALDYVEKLLNLYEKLD